jgi:hypothetical protein
MPGAPGLGAARLGTTAIIGLWLLAAAWLAPAVRELIASK